MIVGVLTLDLAVFESQGLKDKRRVIQSVKKRLQNTFNVSVAEVDFCDLPKRCKLGVAIVCNESRPIHSQLDKVVELVQRCGGLTLLSHERQLL